MPKLASQKKNNKMDGFWGAIRFLTIFPVPEPSKWPGDRMLKYFPLVGMILGLGLALLAIILSGIPKILLGLIGLLYLSVMTGGLHLDGLADTGDAAFSHRARDEKLVIMKDSRIGTMGSLTLFFVLSLKWTALSIIMKEPQGRLLLIIIPSLSRASMVIALLLLPYLHPKNGMGKDLISGDSFFSHLWLLFIPILLLLSQGISGLIVIAEYLSILLLLLAYFKRTFGGITGDICGALNEVMECILFLLGTLTL